MITQNKWSEKRQCLHITEIGWLLYHWTNAHVHKQSANLHHVHVCNLNLLMMGIQIILFINQFLHKMIHKQWAFRQLSNWQVWYIWQMVATFCAIPERFTGASLSTIIVHSVLQLASGFKLSELHQFWLILIWLFWLFSFWNSYWSQIVFVVLIHWKMMESQNNLGKIFCQ